jgi:hypothetical protein
MRIAFKVVRSFAPWVGSAVLMVATPMDASATEITKTYSFGPGTGTHTARAAFRDFRIPCGTPGAISVTVSFKRFGPEDHRHSFSIDVRIHEPVRPGQTEGLIPSAGAYGVTVHTAERAVTVGVAPTAGGCSQPWVVRVKTREGDPPYTVSGSIKLKYAGETRDLTVSTMSNQYLNKGQSKTLLIANSAGCGQGRMVITGTWNHTIGIMPGPLPIQLKFELLNDAAISFGATDKVTEAFGYSNNELRAELTKLRLVFQIPDCRVGQWKLKITNISNDDAFLGSISAKMTPTCP